MQESTETKDNDQESVVFPEDDFGTPATETIDTPAETPAVPEVAEVADASEAPQADNIATADAEAPQPENAAAGEEPDSSTTFADFGFSDELMQGINEAGFTEPTPIQKMAMPLVMAGKDLIGQALTGSGKTAAFGLPIIDKIRHQPGLNFLVLVPTRELATQVSGELFRLGRYTGLKTAAFTGGQSYSRQEQLLRNGINALVATPGRLIDLIDSGHFNNINPAHIVVDEADEMLDMGFIEDVRTIFATFPGPRQTMLFSATMPKPVVELAEEILNDPTNITTSVNETANNDIEQLFFVIEESERANAVIRLIDAEDVTKAMIFCRTKEETDALNILLSGRGYNVNCLHGDMEQAQRSRVMNAFRRGEIDILVATDVAARGLDVDDVTHVFNYHLPFDSRGYVHRIGRTGRAGKSGTAITLVTPREMRQLDMIKKAVGAQMENRLVPTRTQVTEHRLKKIFRDLNEVDLDVTLLNQVQTLTTNQDLEVLIAKLVAHELCNGGDNGPEHIGIGGQRLERLLSPNPRERRLGERGERDGGRFGRRGDRFGQRRQQRAEGRYNPKLERPDRPRRSDRPALEDAPAATAPQAATASATAHDFQEPAREAAAFVPKEHRDDATTRNTFERRERPDRSRLFGRKFHEGDYSRPPYEDNAPNWKHYSDEEAPERHERSFDDNRDEHAAKSFGDRKPFGEKKSFGDRKPFGEKKSFGDRKPFGEKKSFGDRKPFGEKKSFGDRKAVGDSKPFGEKRAFGEKKSFGEKKTFSDRGGKARRNLPPPPPSNGGNWYFN